MFTEKELYDHFALFNAGHLVRIEWGEIKYTGDALPISPTMLRDLGGKFFEVKAMTPASTGEKCDRFEIVTDYAHSGKIVRDWMLSDIFETEDELKSYSKEANLNEDWAWE